MSNRSEEEATEFYRELCALVEEGACGIGTMGEVAERIGRGGGWASRLAERAPKREDFANLVGVFCGDPSAAQRLVLARLRDELPPGWAGRLTLDGEAPMPAGIGADVERMLRDLPGVLALRPDLAAWLLQWWRGMTGAGGLGGSVVAGAPAAAKIRVGEDGSVEIG